jgi:peptidoglycan/LPS O-acetylase OafA/YrhL
LIFFNFTIFAGLISRIFSSKIFVRINKLTYAIYLLNPLIITTAFGSFEKAASVDPSLYFILIVGVTVVTYLFAIVFTLLFEIPFVKLSNEILKGSTPPSIAGSSLAAKKLN